MECKTKTTIRSRSAVSACPQNGELTFDYLIQRKYAVLKKNQESFLVLLLCQISRHPVSFFLPRDLRSG